MRNDPLQPWAWRDYNSRQADRLDRWHRLKRRLRSLRLAAAVCGITGFLVWVHWVFWTQFTNLNAAVGWAALAIVAAITELHATILEEQLRRFEGRDVDSI